MRKFVSPGAWPPCWLSNWTVFRFDPACCKAERNLDLRPSCAMKTTFHVGSPTGPAKMWKGAGRMIAPAKIRIGFFAGLVQKDYWVVDRSDDYSWSIMSMPDRKYVWIMSRRPVLTAPQKAALVARAQSLGYDTARLVYDEQSPAA